MHGGVRFLVGKRQTTVYASGGGSNNTAARSNASRGAVHVTLPILLALVYV